jgi:hypothetical protein
MSVTKLSASDFAVKKLNKNINLSQFNCSNEDGLGLNEFIHEEALDYQKEAMVLLIYFIINKEL